MDNATNYLLIQESKISNLIKSMKIILPNIQSAILKNNTNVMKKIAKKLPQKDMNSVERDAVRKIPGFKEDYLVAKKRLMRIKEIDNRLNKPAAIGVALISATTKGSVDDVIKKGTTDLRNSKFLSLNRLSITGNVFPIAKLVLFFTFILAIYLTDGQILIPTVTLILTSLSLLFSLISEGLSGTVAMINIGNKLPEIGPKLHDALIGDTSTKAATKNFYGLGVPRSDSVEGLSPMSKLLYPDVATGQMF